MAFLIKRFWMLAMRKQTEYQDALQLMTLSLCQGWIPHCPFLTVWKKIFSSKMVVWRKPDDSQEEASSLLRGYNSGDGDALHFTYRRISPVCLVVNLSHSLSRFIKSYRRKCLEEVRPSVTSEPTYFVARRQITILKEQLPKQQCVEIL